MKLNFKSTLLTGSAIVAVGALMGAGQHARAAAGADAAAPTADNNIYNGTNRGRWSYWCCWFCWLAPGMTVSSLLAAPTTTAVTSA
jgi:hypothetical protein